MTLVTTPSNYSAGDVPVISPQIFTREQIDLIKRTVAVGATDDELKLFLYTCQKRRLDPLAKQIYFQKRRAKNGPDRVTIITSIDAYRLTADRTGLYAGNDDPVFDSEESPSKASVTVWKFIRDTRCPFTASARWDHYYPGDDLGFIWRKMPHLMLGKCAEALALRKAFPEELGGLYIDEEMEQAGQPLVPQGPPSQGLSKAGPTAAVAIHTYDGETPELKAVLFTIAKKLGVTKREDLVKLNQSCKGLEMVHLEQAATEWVEDNLPKIPFAT